MWLRLIIEIAILALTVVSIVSLLRALGPIRRMVERGTKPWSCDVCLSFWVTLAAACATYFLLVALGSPVEPQMALAILPAQGLALLILSRIRPPDLPSLFEEKV
jgi:hypothetical protein